MKRFLIALVLALVIGDVAARLVAQFNTREPTFTGSVRIAYVGRQAGATNRNAGEMAAAAGDLIEQVNAKGGIGGLKVELVSFDDGNDADRARAVAQQIAADPRIVAVIGHSSSNGSQAAGPIYAQAGIPAITPRSTAPDVTEGNPWYFRTIFSDDREGEFLTSYARDVLGASGIALVRTPNRYAERMAGVMHREAGEMGLPILADWGGDPLAADAAGRLEALTRSLAELPPDTVVLLLAYQRTAVPLIKAIRDAGIKLRILGPDPLGTIELANAFARMPREQTSPGFYTTGLFVSAPFLADTANVEARQLIQRMAQKVGAMDSWSAPYAYDAAKVLVEAMQRAGFGPEIPADGRRAVRDQLAQMRSPGLGVPGATGVTWFDEHGNAMKPVTIGQFSNLLMSSLMQLHQNVQNDELTRVPVVYSGLSPRRIERVADAPNQVDVDFDLWFRFQGDVPVTDIGFLGAVRPIALGEPVKSSSVGGIEYRRFHVVGRFQMAAEGAQAAQGRIAVPIVFHHRSLSQNQLIYVPDSTALPALSGPPLARLLSRTAVLPDGFTVTGATLYADTLERSTLGDPTLTVGAVPVTSAPGVALTVELGRSDPSLRRQWLTPEAEAAALALALAFALLLWLSDTDWAKRRPRGVLLLLAAATGGVLLTGECAALRLLIDLGLERAIGEAIRFFDLLWWLASGALLLAATEKLVWTPLEAATARPVPRVIKTFVAGVVLVLTLFGIVSNVFARDVTGLMAGSGLVAMIVGLAVQSNLSNVFSGIALNIERPIRPGDWIKIGDNPVAQVVDISWRATKVRTFANTMLNIPNSVVTGARLENFSYPEPHFLIERAQYVPADLDPARVIELLTDALRLARPVDGRRHLDVTRVMYTGVDAMGARYLLKFDCTDRSKAGSQEQAVLLSVHRALARAGIPMMPQMIPAAEPEIAQPLRQPAPAVLEVPADALLAEMEPFATLRSEERQRLAAAAQRRTVAAGTTLFREGDAADALFLVASGVLVAVHRGAGGEREVGRFGPGALVGIEALLEGERRLTTVSALGRAVVYALARDSAAHTLEPHPELMDCVSELMTRNQLAAQEVEAASAADAGAAVTIRSRILSRLGGLFFATRNERV
ncbi:ABC transporter substrate-binding protein [Azospirillum sp. sgz302134]